MKPELHNFYAALTEILRANHGESFVISMSDHQRRLIVRRTPDGAAVLQTEYMGTIPLTDTVEKAG